MSQQPSWLTDEDTADVAVKIASNPVAQSAAKKAAQDPAVQKAMMNQVKTQVDAQTPDWAKSQDSSSSAVPVSSNDVNVQGGGGGGGDVESGESKSVNPYGSDIPQEDIDKMKKYHTFLRILYVVAAIMVATAAGFALDRSPQVGVALFALYGIFFAFLIFGFELHWKGIGSLLAANFGFMYSIVGRWIFLLFVGFIMLQLGTLGIVAMSVLYFVGLVHIFFICRFPYFPEYQRMLHYAYLA